MTLGSGAKVRYKTNAKLNLFLHVLGRRPDGFHEIESIFHGIALGDDLEITPTGTGRAEIAMRHGEGSSGELPGESENLISDALKFLHDRGMPNEGIRVEVTKRIPIGAGLGGGSGNAAGALVALNEIWELEIDRDAMNEIAASVGADVPYCLGGGTALATSKGDILTPLPSPQPMWFVLGISTTPLLTRDVYDAWDGLGSVQETSSAAMTLALGSGDLLDVASLLHNDLESAAFSLRPELERKKERMAQAGALGAALTGSGPTVFGIASDEDHARTIAGRVEGHFDRVLVTSSTERCVERVG